MDIEDMNFFSNQLKPVLEEEYVTDLLTDEDRHLIKLKKRLMRLALNSRTKFDFGQHKGSNNLGIINFCKFCDIDPEQFMRRYLRNLQPFMIHLVDNRCDNLTNFVCMIDELYEDYRYGRSNPFAYIRKGMTAREVMELRKSAMLRLPKDFFDSHPRNSVEDIVNYRITYLKHLLKDYNDEHWQFWWATRLFIPYKKSWR